MLAYSVQGLRGHRWALVPGGGGDSTRNCRDRGGEKSSTGTFMEGSLWGHPDGSEKMARDSMAEMSSGVVKRKPFSGRRNKRGVVDSNLAGVCTQEP